eukprot:880523_1
MPKPRTKPKKYRPNILLRAVNYEKDGSIVLNFRSFRKGNLVNDKSVQNLLFDPRAFKEYDGNVYSKIKFINFGNCDYITDHTLILISQLCHHVEKLTLSHCTYISDYGIISVVSHNPNLKWLDISSTWASHECIAAVSDYCTNLQKIWASGSNIAFLPDNIVNLQYLKYLNLQNNCIAALPRSTANLNGKCILILTGNPLIFPPLHAIDRKSAATFKRYVENIDHILHGGVGVTTSKKENTHKENNGGSTTIETDINTTEQTLPMVKMAGAGHLEPHLHQVQVLVAEIDYEKQYNFYSRSAMLTEEKCDDLKQEEQDQDQTGVASIDYEKDFNLYSSQATLIDNCSEFRQEEQEQTGVASIDYEKEFNLYRSQI